MVSVSKASTVHKEPAADMNASPRQLPPRSWMWVFMLRYCTLVSEPVCHLGSLLPLSQPLSTHSSAPDSGESAAFVSGLGILDFSLTASFIPSGWPSIVTGCPSSLAFSQVQPMQIPKWEIGGREKRRKIGILGPFLSRSARPGYVPRLSSPLFSGCLLWETVRFC